MLANQPTETFCGESIRDIIAWLEKQKESWVPTDEQRHALGIVIKHSNPNADSTKVLESLLDDLTKIANPKVAKWKEKQKEQKPADLPPGFYYITEDGKRYYTKEFRYKVVENEKPAWKPSEDQMVGLLIAIGDEEEKGSDVVNPLRSLYYDLKKLTLTPLTL